MALRDAPVPASEHPVALCVHEGQEAPDFALQGTDGDLVRLRDLRGQWVVLYFYPEDHTPGCTVEARRFRDYFEAISLQEAAIVGISRDNQENHCSFREKHQIPFEILSDPDGRVHDLYGAWRPAWFRRDVIYARRCTFIIDPGGTVAKCYPKVNVLNHAQEVVQDLEALARGKPVLPAA